MVKFYFYYENAFVSQSGPIGEVLEGDTEQFRITLNSCPPENGDRLKQIVHLSVDQTTGDFF